jgi:hypothetical protein
MREWYILEGKIPIPCDLQTFACWVEQHGKEKIVEQEEVGHYWVSTVFLGINYSWSDSPPLLFETMVFDHSSKEHPYDRLWIERTSTWEMALEAHQRGVAWAKEQLR